MFVENRLVFALKYALFIIALRPSINFKIHG